MSASTSPVRVQVTLRGDAGYVAGDEARAAVEQAIGAAHCAVRSANVVVGVRSDPASRDSAEVEAVLDVGDTLVCAASSAPTLAEAIDVVEHRLCAGLLRHGDRAQMARRVPRRGRPQRR